MASRKCRNRSYSIISQAKSDQIENMEDSELTSFEVDPEVTIKENPVAEQVEQNANIVVTSNENVTICTDYNVNNRSTSATQLQNLTSTLLHTSQSENCKLTE
jgi:hypothetical protein